MIDASSVSSEEGRKLEGPEAAALNHEPPRVVDIRPSRGLFDLEIDTVWRYRELLWVLIAPGLQVIYRQGQ